MTREHLPRAPGGGVEGQEEAPGHEGRALAERQRQQVLAAHMQQPRDLPAAAPTALFITRARRIRKG